MRRTAQGPVRLLLPFLVCLLAACHANYPALFDRDLISDDAMQNGICLVHGQLLVGPELTRVDDGDLCFKGNVILSLGPHGTVQIPDGAVQWDVHGATVLPGLVDTHVHVLVTEAPPWEFRLPDPEHNLEAWLWSGITTAFDMGGTPDDLQQLRQKIADREILGPQIFFCHEPISAPDGHPIPAITSILPWPIENLLATTVPVIENADEASEIVADADHLVHGVYREAISTAVIDAARDRSVTITYTAAPFDNTRLMSLGRYQPPVGATHLSDPELVAAVSGESGGRFGELPVLGDFSRGIASTQILEDNIRRLHEAGVVVLVGTDSPIAGVFPGLSFHEELRFLACAGIPADALVRRVTVLGARLLSNAPGFGILEVGARADVLVVNGDPMLNIEALQDIVHVFAAGIPLNRIVAE